MWNDNFSFIISNMLVPLLHIVITSLKMLLGNALYLIKVNWNEESCLLFCRIVFQLRRLNFLHLLLLLNFIYVNLSFSDRTFVAPLERLKLEYMVRGADKKLFELIKTIATTQGLKGFWKGNLVNILRTAPFKAVNFYAYDTYRKQLAKFSGNEETTNSERFIAGAAAGITATVLCLPLDTVSG